MLYLSAGMMFAFVATPYLPARFPLLSALHVFSALLSTVVLFFCLLFLAFKLYWTAPGKGRPCLLLLIATAVFCISSFILSGIINTAMEISFVLACRFADTALSAPVLLGARPGQEAPLRFLFNNKSPDASRAFE